MYHSEMVKVSSQFYSSIHKLYPYYSTVGCHPVSSVSGCTQAVAMVYHRPVSACLCVTDAGNIHRSLY